MRVLALDTTTRPGSVALVAGDEIVDERPGDAARSHAESLPGALVALLAAHGLTTASIDLFAVASGPGSFTGLRIGIATIQGLALVGGRRVVAVSSLEALGQMGSTQTAADGAVAVWIDAHRRDVFAALYRVTTEPLFESARLRLADGPVVDAPSALLARWSSGLPGTVSWIGDGAIAYAAAIESALGPSRILAPPRLAGAIGRMAAVRARRGEAVHPAAVHPLYVRRPDAEIDRERRTCTTMDGDGRKG
jgi:tRNA threonylcarbamoyladenosine biosynthesis protein TsaB